MSLRGSASDRGNPILPHCHPRPPRAEGSTVRPPVIPAKAGTCGRITAILAVCHPREGGDPVANLPPFGIHQTNTASLLFPKA